MNAPIATPLMWLKMVFQEKENNDTFVRIANAIVLGQRQDRMFLKLKRMLKPFGITKFYTDNLQTYERHLSKNERIVSKYKMQKIERKHLTLRTRIKRLQRKTICFSKISPMHDLVIGLYINKYEFHRDII